MSEPFKFEQAPDEDRIGMLCISETLMLDILSGRAKLTGIPEGAVMEAAFYNHQTRCWDIRVRHRSFDAVPDGGLIQPMYCVIEYLHDSTAEDCPKPTHVVEVP